MLKYSDIIKHRIDKINRLYFRLKDIEDSTAILSKWVGIKDTTGKNPAVVVNSANGEENSPEAVLSELLKMRVEVEQQLIELLK
jgi:hypothetical protein